MAALVPYAHGVARRHAPRPRVVRVDLDEELARAAPMRIHVAVAGVQEVQRLAGDQLKAVAGADLARPGQRIVPVLEERHGIQLGLARSRREAAVRKGPPVVGAVQPRVAFLPQPFVGNPLEPRMAARQRRAQHRLVALEEPRFGATERARQPAEQFGVRH